MMLFSINIKICLVGGIKTLKWESELSEFYFSHLVEKSFVSILILEKMRMF